MKNCKECANFYDAGSEYYCSELLTHCAANDKPDLGTRLSRCAFEKIEKTKKKKEEQNNG